MSFREAMDLVELPIVTFYIGDKKVNFLLDTGANASIINEAILDKIEYSASENTNSVMGIEGNAKKANCVNIDLMYKDNKYTEEFQVMDMSGVFGAMRQECGVVVNGLIGTSFFSKYKYVLDFKEFIAYSKK